MASSGAPHDGHRQRMFKKYLEHGIGVFEEHELLEMLLFPLLPRINTNEISHNLINKFGSLKSTLGSSVNDMKSVRGIGQNTATMLKFCGDLAKYLSDQSSKVTTFYNSNSIIDFCIEYYRNSNRECVSFFLIDDKMTLVYKSDIEVHKPNEANFDYSEILKQVINHECSSLILSHNHPIGNVYASNSDIAVTRTLATLLKALNVRIVDHIIIQNDTGYSMRSSGEAMEIWY